MVLVTTRDEGEAAKIASALVSEKLAACAGIVRGVRSIYIWKGEVCDETECLMLIKTTKPNFDAVERRVRELHSYELPEVVALPIVAGSKPYLDWLEENCRVG